MDLECDILVVGAGPAGSMTAKLAAKGGANVLIIEKRQEIGSPVRCGEGISKRWMKDVGLEPDRKWIAHEVEGARIVAPNGSSLVLSDKNAGNEVGIVLERDIFDKALASQAVKAGADIMLRTAAVGVLKKEEKVVGVRARSGREEFNIHSKIVVGADGFESQVGRWAGIDTKLAPKDIVSCFQYRLTNIDIDHRYCHFIVGSVAPGAYVWVFPKSEDTANVGIGLPYNRMKERGDVKMYLEKHIENDPGLRKGKVLDAVAGAVSVCAPVDETVGDGIILVGDAARQIDSMTGGGISNACFAANVAGKVLAEAVEAGDYSKNFLRKYENGWRDLLENKLYRDYMAKEKLMALPDDVFNKIVETLAKADIESMTIFEILRVLKEKQPDLVKEFEDLI